MSKYKYFWSRGGQSPSDKFSHLETYVRNTEDGKEIFKDQDFWYVTKCFQIREYSADECWTPKIDGIEFSTKQLAQEYVLMNSPCLSVNDTMKILEHYTDVVKCWSNEEFKNSIVELAKSKIKNQ